MKIKNGFSLVEIIVAITIIAVLGVVITTILTRTFRANSQSDVIARLKQNGDSAVTFMGEITRSAEAVVCYGPPDNTYASPNQTRKDQMVIRTLTGKYIKFQFIDPVIVSGKVTQNGYVSRRENLNPADQTNFCNSSLSSPPQILMTNNNSQTGVSISNGKFTKLSGNVGKDTITIQFDVNPSLSITGAGSDPNTVKVQTTVQIR